VDVFVSGHTIDSAFVSFTLDRNWYLTTLSEARARLSAGVDNCSRFWHDYGESGEQNNLKL